MSNPDNKTLLLGELFKLGSDLSTDELALVLKTIVAFRSNENPVDNPNFESKATYYAELLRDILYADDKHSDSILKKLSTDDTSPTDLNARGKKRVYRKYRTREEIGGDPLAEENRRDVKLNSRVPKELRDQWEKSAIHVYGKRGRGKALEEALQDFIKKHPLEPNT